MILKHYDCLYYLPKAFDLDLEKQKDNESSISTSGSLNHHYIHVILKPIPAKSCAR